jgi:hypothetical protein
LLPEVIYSCDIHYQVQSPVETHPNSLSSASWDAHLEFDIWSDLEDARLVKLCLFQWIYFATNDKCVSIVKKRENARLSFILIAPVINRHSGIHDHGGFLHAQVVEAGSDLEQ